MVAVIMGSKSDWDVMKHCCDILTQFGVPHEKRVLSAHRTPAAAAEFISTAEKRGVKVLIAAAGGAAHLAGVAAAHTLLPVLGVPMESACDSEATHRMTVSQRWARIHNQTNLISSRRMIS